MSRFGEEPLRVLFDKGHVGVAILSSDGYFSAVNSAFAEFVGYPQGELLSREFCLVVHPDEHATVTSRLRRLRTGRIEHCQYQDSFLHKDGHIVKGITGAYRLPGSDVGADSIVLQVQDITQFKRAEAKPQRDEVELERRSVQFSDSAPINKLVRWQTNTLRESEARFNEVQKIAHIGSFEWFPDTDAERWSEELYKMFGVDPEVADVHTVRTVLSRLHPDDVSRVKRAIRTTAQSGTPWNHEYRICLSSGKVRHVHSIGRREEREIGKPIRVVGTVQDISERKLAERLLEESEARFKDYAETAAHFFWEMDADLKYTHFTGRFEELTGIPQTRALGATREEVWVNWAVGFDEGVAPFPAVKAQQPYENVEVQWVDSSGSTRTLSTSGKPVFDCDGVFMGYRGSSRDVTEIYTLTEKLSYEATHDVLTGLINRSEFERRVGRVVETTRGLDDEHALCYLDLDQFKVINDTCGHIAGDELLCQLGHLLSNTTRKRDTLARLGGDEFGVLMEHCTLEQARRVAGNVRSAVEDFRFGCEKQVFRIGVSIGVVPITSQSGDVVTLMSAADSACYAAKDMGRNRVHVYHIDDTALARRHGEMRWVSRINQALEEDRLQLWSQLIEPIGSGSDEGEHFELLLRLIDERGATILPSVFLPAAERYGLSIKIDHWVVAAAFEWLSSNSNRLKQLHLCCINLSGNSLTNDEFLPYVQAQLEQFHIPPTKICFEITETAAISNLSKAMTFMGTLKACGCRFSLDDFGSGLSSFAYLKTLPIDYLKIDGAFVKGIVNDEVDLALVRAVSDVGKAMGKKTIAEFVENRAILGMLREIGVDYAQGYSIGLPIQVGETKLTDLTATRMLEPVSCE